MQIKPGWLTKRAPDQRVMERMENLLSGLRLHTVCQEAACPNVGECFARRTATFMLLGDICTRNCRFCAVKKGRPGAVPAQEPARVAEAVLALELAHVVLTSVTRDDLLDGGAGHFARTIAEIRGRSPRISVEVLTPDFLGQKESLKVVLDAGPAVFNHNIETVPRLYPQVRPQASYRRSIELLRMAGELAPGVRTKSGLMVGLGERPEEVREVMEDLRGAGCDMLTVGQYLAPSSGHLPVREFVPPETFDDYRKWGRALGFSAVASGPFVRSSLGAGELFGRIAETNRPSD